MKLLTCLLLFFAVSGPARAQLVFQGKWPNESQVRREFGRFPARLQARLVTTRLILKVGALPGDIDGDYDDRTRTLTVEQPGDMSLLDHEAGHAYFCLALTLAERTAWPHFWHRHRADFPTRYSRSDPDEGFAEAFRTCYDGSRLRPVVKAKLQTLGVP